MGIIESLLQDVSIPRFVKVRQHFSDDHIPPKKISEAVKSELSRSAIADRVKPGMRICLTCGSRGIDNIAAITAAVADFCKERGAQPFAIPAMGSHGGASAQGQREVLRSLGITEESIGCPIFATMDTVRIGSTEEGEPVYIDRYAAEADGIIVINGSAAIDPHLGLPVVTLYPNQGCAGPISIRGDISAAITAAFAHFRSRNVTDIGFIGDPQTFLKQQLLAKFGEALGMPLREKYICISDARFEAGGYAAMETFFKAGNLPQAIFCAYDYMAIGAIRCILDHGLSVPNDIAVIGMDDIPEAKYLNPSLSSINVNMDKTCRIAAEAIIRCLTEQPFALSEKVTCDLHLRASTDIK